MRYPTMGKNLRNAVSVPALSGGVNRADALNLVDDNQMTDCKNVWYKDGMLQTRPGINAKPERQQGSVSQILKNAEIQKNTVDIDGIEYKLAVTIDGSEMHIYALSASYNGLTNDDGFTNNFVELEATFTSETIPQSYVFYNGKTTKEKGKGLYMLTSLADETTKLYELVDNEFQLLTSDELYSPIVYINGKGTAYESLPSDVTSKYASPSLFEGHSAISDAWARFYFTTDSDSNIYRLPVDVRNSVFKVEYTTLDGVTKTTAAFKLEEDTLKISLEDNSMSENANAQVIGGEGQGSMRYDAVSGGLRFRVNNYTNSFIFVKEDGSMVSDIFDNAIGTITNNLMILIKPTNPSKSLLAGATISQRFGGSAEGIYGGTRIFLSGIKKGDNRNLIAWSGLNEPTYFSENNYVHVGEVSQRITSLEKQDNMLVIFKNKEIYYSVYSTGQSYTAEDVLKGKVIDVSTLDANFPITQINSNIGCDLPDTVRLCGDRLVWANRDNKVYILRSANQYNPVNVSIISQMLGSGLNLSVKSTATTYDGFYMLKSKNKIYMLNFDQYYFNTLHSYSDSKKANRKMQWFMWELPEVNEATSGFVSNAENLALLIYIQRDSGVQPFIWEFLKTAEQDSYRLEDGTKMFIPIESVIQTKLFDFGAMERFKAIEQMYIEFGKSQGDVEVQYLTERGRLDELRVDLTDTAEENSPEFIKTKRLLPGIKRALRFGMRLTAKGQVKLGGILIKFKYMGVTR